MADDEMERERDPYEEAVGWVKSYLQYLRDLNVPQALVGRRERDLMWPAVICVAETGHGLDAIPLPPPGRAPAWPRGDAKRAFRDRMDSLRAFLAWRHRGEPEGPTVERLAELERLRGHGGAKLPVGDDVRKLLAAPGRETTAGRTDMVAMTLAAHEGLSAEDLCGLRVGDVDLDGRRLQVHPAPPDVVEPDGGTDEGTDHEAGTEGEEEVSLAPVRSVALDDWWVKLLGPLVEGEASERPLLRSRTGEALTPRRLQQRTAEHVKALGDGLSAPLTLERLRDYAAYQTLVGGGTLEEVARRLGYTRAASVRTRFGGEAWAYLADREDSWFSLETVAEVEGIEADELRRWADSGMRHARDGERILVRKTDVRGFMRRPRPPRPPRPPLTEEEKAEITKRIIPHPLFDALGAGGGGAVDETLEDVLADLMANPPAAEPPSYAERFTELTEAVKPALWRLWKLRQKSRRAEDGAKRVSLALELPVHTALHEVASDFLELRKLLCVEANYFGVVDTLVRTVRDFEPDSWVRRSWLGLFDSVLGVDQLCTVLRSEQGAAAFFLLVDRYSEELQADLAAARDYYGVTKEAMDQKAPGCLLYAFFLALLLADPAIPLDPRGPIATHEELMLEFVPRWLCNLLWRAGAVPSGPPGAFGRAPRITHLADDGFIEAFQERWRELSRYRRGAWSYRVLPALSMADLARYRGLMFGKGEPDSVLRGVLNYMLYLAKLAPGRPLCAPIHSAQTSAWYVYALHLPVVEQEYTRAMEDMATEMDCGPEELERLVPGAMGKEVRDLCLAAVAAFSFARGGAADGGTSGEGPGTAFVTYLRRRAQRYLVELGKRVRAADSEGSASAPEALAEHIPDPCWTPGGEVSGIPLCLDGTGIEAATMVPMVVGPDGQRYLTTWWASRIGGRSQRWVQLHARELGALRADEVFPDSYALLEEGLSADQHLFAYDEGLADRIHTLRTGRSRAKKGR